jgi:hypothetical protein
MVDATCIESDKEGCLGRYIVWSLINVKELWNLLRFLDIK